MTTNSNANGVAMIAFLVFVALRAAKVSSINIFLHIRLFFNLHTMLLDVFLAARFISVALSYYSMKGVSQNRQAASLDNRARRAGCFEVAGK